MPLSHLHDDIDRRTSSRARSRAQLLSGVVITVQRYTIRKMCTNYQDDDTIITYHADNQENKKA